MRRCVWRSTSVLAVAALLAMSGAAWAVPFQTGFDSGGNWNFAYAQGFSPSVRANPDPFTDPMLGLEDTVNLSRFRFFKSGYEVSAGEPLVTTNFQLAIVDNFFLDLSLFTTSSPELVGLSTNTIATTASYATGAAMDFLFDDLELSYGAIDYAAIFVRNDGAGNFEVVGVPVMIVNYVETPPESGTWLPDVDYGDPNADWVYSASNFRTDNYLNSFNAPYGDVSFVAFFNEVATPFFGDFNNDGVVDAADYTVWRNHLGEDDESNINNNGDGMGGVDPADYLVWKQHYGNMAGSGGLAGAVVPEPGALAMVFLAGGAMMLGASGRRGRDAGARRS